MHVVDALCTSAEPSGTPAELPQPRLSVVIPTCDRNEELALCLDRMQPSSQEIAFSDYEVIVTDDGQTEEAKRLIESKFPWAKWVAGPRRGPAANRNHGASQAHGDWIVFTDDDCLPQSDWLIAFLNAAEEGVCVLEGKTVCKAGLPGLLYEAPLNEDGGRFWSCNLAVQRKLFTQIGGFDERFPFANSEDAEFRDRIQRHGVPTKFVSNAVVDHPPRLRPFGSAWNKRWQSKVLYEIIADRTMWNRPSMALRVAVHRFRELRQATTVNEVTTALLSMSIETFHVARNRRRWNDWAMEVARGSSSKT